MESGKWFWPAFCLRHCFLLRPPAVRGLEVTILDTGQGDGICIRTRNQVILVDGGSTDQKELGQYRLEPFFQSKGIRQIDLAIVTHGDWDHISGLSWLLEQASEEESGNGFRKDPRKSTGHAGSGKRRRGVRAAGAAVRKAGRSGRVDRKGGCGEAECR